MIFLIFTRFKEAFMDDFLILVNNVTNIDLKIFLQALKEALWWLKMLKMPTKCKILRKKMYI